MIPLLRQISTLTGIVLLSCLSAIGQGPQLPKDRTPEVGGKPGDIPGRVRLESPLSGSVFIPLLSQSPEENRPTVLNRSGSQQGPLEPEDVFPPVSPVFRSSVESPLGFTGPSSVLPTEAQQSAHFVPIEDRWRIGIEEWDRYGKGHPEVDDYPNVKGHWYDPFNQNVLKGDFPIIGQHTFLTITGTSQSLHEYREVPIATGPFESTSTPSQQEFFGDPEQYFGTQYFKLSVNLAHGSTAAFKPVDWQVRVTPVFNMNYLDVEELGVVSPDTRRGTTRYRQDWALEEFFIEAKLADLSPDYDFVSARAGSQFFVSDFKGHIFSDTNLGMRIFGSRLSNRDQFNLVYFDQFEKETNSELNTFRDRDQNTLIANYYRQDFIFPGLTAQVSFHYNNDGPSTQFDKNDFLVRPDPAGVFQPHRVESYYLGFATEGHIGRINVSQAFYHVMGRDSLNPIQGVKSDISANMAALELSIDRDWIRFRTSMFYASGDDDPNDDKAEGFDAIFDNPAFAGGEFSYWQRQAVRIFGVNLVNARSLIPNMRSSKTQGQTNFVNPGLFLLNYGMDFELTPKLRAISNFNYLWFQETQVIEKFTFQGAIDERIGADLSLGFEYRPFLNDNVLVLSGVSGFFPAEGINDIFGVTNPFTIDNAGRRDAPDMYAAFVELILTY